jgi:hypothetical protein
MAIFTCHEKRPWFPVSKKTTGPTPTKATGELLRANKGSFETIVEAFARMQKNEVRGYVTMGYLLTRQQTKFGLGLNSKP